jgi:hypothetical protein
MYTKKWLSSPFFEIQENLLVLFCIQPPVIKIYTRGCMQEPLVLLDKNPHIMSPPLIIKSSNIPSQKEKRFFMGDGSKTHEIFIQFYSLVVRILSGKF